MAREWWQRLPAAQRAEYERSAAITRLALRPAPELAVAAFAIQDALAADDRVASERAAQHLVGLLCAGLSIRSAAVRVAGMRPHDGRGELHGLYTPNGGAGRDRITVWMRTARRKDVVAVKTFLRTLLHEVCHHIDFFALDLPHSFHTPGFYQRESSLFRAVTRGTPLAVRRGGAPRRRDQRKELAEIAAAAAAAEARAAAREVATAARALGLEHREAEGTPPLSGIDLLRATAAAIAARQHRDD